MMVSEACGRCGVTLLPNAAYCGACGEPVNRADQIDIGGRRTQLASGGRRVLGYGIDLAILYGVQTVFSLLGLLGAVGLTADRDRFREYRLCVQQATTVEARQDCASELWPHLAWVLLLAFLVPLVIALVYWSVCNSLGRSVGKRVAGTRIVNRRGGRPGIWRGLLRTFSALFLSAPFFALGYLWAFWDPQRRTWHDMIAGTRVIRALPYDRGGAYEAVATEAPPSSAP